MADIIHLLPDSVANQIAAGEVIQRPSSVVKELMENSIDANANEINVLIKNSGKTLIQILDNGNGMSDTDARLSFERHATSKIKKAEDLFSLHTMGFRGEALASIAAIAQVEMKTCRAGQELGVLLIIEGSKVKQQENVSCNKGTMIQVKNIFFTIPARRNFLKSNHVETKHIVEEFQYLAIAHPNKAFKLIHDTKIIYDLHPTKLIVRISSMFGKSYQNQLAPCNEETTSLQITGYIGHPTLAKKTRGHQFLFVNSRYIKNHYINHAIMSAFEGLLPTGTHPFYVLFLEIDPKQIDVNIHPTKTEIKFDDPRTIYAIIQATIKKALGLHNFAPTINFKTDVNIISNLDNRNKPKQNHYTTEQHTSFSKKNTLNPWEKLFETERTSPVDKIVKINKTVPTENAVNKNGLPLEKRIAIQCHNKYIIRETQTGVIIINQQAAHERILYEKYILSLRKTPGESQHSLFPQTIEFMPTDFALVMEIKEEIQLLGFNFEIFGKNTILISSAPPDVLGKEKEIFEGFIEQFKINKANLSLPHPENLAWSLAKKTSIRQGQHLNQDEINALVEQLFACTTPSLSSQGKPSFITLETSKIDHFFNL